MFTEKLTKYWTLLYSGACLSIVALVLWFGASLNATTANSEKTEALAPAVSYPANTATLGLIPDNAPGTPRDVTFTVGISGAPTFVSADMTFGGAGLTTGHTWAGDINVTLIAPNAASFNLFGRTGQTAAGAFGDSSDLTGPYNFADTVSGTNWWLEAFNRLPGEALTPGNYRTTAVGPQAASNFSPTTNLSAAFASVPNVNGTWTMRFTDNAGGDTGGVSAANLNIVTTPSTTRKNADFTGDGKSDFSTVRNITPGFSGDDPTFDAGSYRERIALRAENPPEAISPANHGTNIGWYVNNSLSGADTTTALGQPLTDLLVPSDYDGDGKADIATWRPSATPTMSAFYILNSSTSTIDEKFFGELNDDATVTGDYDGDGKSDLATFRCPQSDGQCFFFYRGSLNNPAGNLTYFAWGFGTPGTIYFSPGDFDGDGKFDFCVQRLNPVVANGGQFVLRRSSDAGVEWVNWGRNTDVIVPGDYDGDGKFDFMVSRNEDLGSGVGKSYYLLTRTGGGTGASPIRWGTSNDIRVPGDYDGDNVTDVAIWRPGTPGTFYVRRSSDSTLQVFSYGLANDYPVANWYVH